MPQKSSNANFKTNKREAEKHALAASTFQSVTYTEITKTKEKFLKTWTLHKRDPVALMWDMNNLF